MTDATVTPSPPRNWFTPRKLLAVGFLIALVVAYVHGPTEHEVREQQARWKAAVNDEPWVWGGIYLAITVTLISLSVPVASGLIIVCGFLFGHWRGALLISIGAPAGALLAMLTSRYLFRNFVRRMASHRPVLERWVAAADRGIERDGWYYLLLLRLTPVIPFFAINVAMGMTRIRPWTYYWVTFLGMLPATLVFVHAGATASEIRSFADLVTIDTILALMLIVLLPITLRAVFPKSRTLTNEDE